MLLFIFTKPNSVIAWNCDISRIGYDAMKKLDQKHL